MSIDGETLTRPGGVKDPFAPTKASRGALLVPSAGSGASAVLTIRIFKLG
jgi:hypothetical protein